MAKVTLTDLTSLANDTSATTSINDNFQTIEDYINNNVLSRDTGAETNTMQNDIDMNNFDILNVTQVNGEDVADLLNGITTASVAAAASATESATSATASATSATASATSATASAASATASAASATAAAASFDEFDDIYLGSFASAPLTDNDGDPLQTGSLYWNTTGSTLYVYDGGWNTAAFDTSGALVVGDLGNTVAGLATDQTFTGSQRGSVTTDNDLSFDLDAANNFSATPTGAAALTFTNHAAGQSGHILLTNSSNYAITAAATTKISATDLTTLSATGVYLLSYFDNGTNTYVVISGDLT